MTTQESLRNSSRVAAVVCTLLLVHTSASPAQEQTRAGPVFKDGEAQPVSAFEADKDWIRHDLWVETSFDSDGDGKRDRMHVSVTRQKQTDTEGLKVPAVYESSPYYSGTGSTDKEHFWSPRQELGADPPKHLMPLPIEQESHRPSISRSHESEWIPRGFAVVHSASPGTGLSQGCPTVGGDNESLAPKAVIDWLNGRASGFATADGTETVAATWCTGKKRQHPDLPGPQLWQHLLQTTAPPAGSRIDRPDHDGYE